MKPQPWFEAAIKVMDPYLRLAPVPEEGVFYLVRKSPRKGGREYWTNVTIPWNRQDQAMLDFIARCNSQNEAEHERFKAERSFAREEPKRDAQRMHGDIVKQELMDHGTSQMSVYQSAPAVGDTFHRGQMEHLVKQANEG